MTRTEAAAAPKNDAPELPDEVSTPRDAATASAELTVDTAWLGEYLLGRWADDRKASRKLASRPEFWFQGDLSLAEHRARVLGQLHTLV
jgi:acyl-CoA oxidase